MTTFTSASANKYLRTLEDEKVFLINAEHETSTYTLAVGENEEPPIYNYDETHEKVREIDRKVRAIRHALHVFNATEVLPESGLTIDEALILLAQLGNEKVRLDIMRSRQPKERVGTRYARNDVIEYRYANYDVARAAADYAAMLERIAALQLEIDLANQTRTFEVEF